MLVLAAGSVALALATRFHDDDATLRRFRKALVNLESLERVRTAWNDHCPLLFKRLVVAVISWRLAGFLFGPRTAAAYLRTTLVVALSVSACLYLPLRDVQHRASDVGKIAGLALVASIFFVALDASAGPDASASLACAAWLARPSLEALDERLKTTSRAAALRTRDLGVVLLASSATEKNRRTLYVGFFGAWFVTSGSRDNDEEDDALGGLFKRL